MLKLNLKVGNNIIVTETNLKQLKVTYKGFIMPVKGIEINYKDDNPKILSAKFILNKSHVLDGVDDKSINLDFFQEFVSELFTNGFSVVYDELS